MTNSSNIGKGFSVTEPSAKNEYVPYCFRCNLPIGKEFGTNCICTVPDVMGASLTARTIRKALRTGGYPVDMVDSYTDNVIPILSPCASKPNALSVSPISPWVPLCTEQEWEQRKKELDIKMNLESDKLERFKLAKEFVGSVSPASPKSPYSVSPTNIKEGIPPKTLMSFSTYLYITFTYPVVEEIRAHIAKSWTVFDFEMECSKDSWDKFIQSPTFQENISVFKTQKLAEKPLENTHPTVLTWLIRYVDLTDIETMLIVMNSAGRRDLMGVAARSLKESLGVLEFADVLNSFKYSKKYEGVGEPPFIGETVAPIIV